MIRAVFFDVGGVLLTNGWDHLSRKKGAELFGYDFTETEKRHALMYSTHELGKISLDTYLDFTYFNQPRSFSKEELTRFIREQSQPFPNMLQWARELKTERNLQIGVVSNEGRELAEYRNGKWLVGLVDFFCISGFVGLRKPDPDIFRLAISLAQLSAHEIIYIDDRPELVKMAERSGLIGIHHTSFEETKRKFTS